MSDAPAHTATPLPIRAEPSAIDPDSCRFIVGRVVHPGEPRFFGSPDEARGSPLAEQLFGLPGVKSVLVAHEVVTVGKGAQTPWSELLRPIGAAIRAQLLTGVPALVALPAVPKEAGSDAELMTLAQELLDKEINPSIASHGGRIQVERAEAGVLYVRMTGGCQGCAASSLTLRQGAERVLRQALPQMKELVDATDHGAGKNPFYTSNPLAAR
jgi:Fe-S cluster biogenesis protein NfuA